jgi:alpha-mannosidase
VTVFNPLLVALDETVDVVLDIPDDYPTFGEFFNFEAKPAFTIHDDAGKELPYQRLGQDMKRIRTRIHDEKFPQHYHVNEVKVSLALRVPAMGYTTLTVKPGAVNYPTRHPQDKGLATSVRSMENELLAVTIEGNGTLTIKDKRSGEVYRDILTFEERADIGDGWFHGVAINDQVAVSTASAADVSLIENGPNVTTFRIRTTMRVPADFNFTTMRRSETRVEILMDSLVRLRPGKDHVEVETTINNTADDHRVRVLFPSGAAAETFLTDTAFDVVERPIAIRPDNHVYAELEVETKPQQSFTAVFGGKRGLAVVSTGQMESTVLDYTDKPVALTLFRGTRRTVLTNGEPNGELRTTMQFRYCVKVLRGEPKVSELFLLGQKVGTGVRLVQARQADVALHGQPRKLPTTGGFLALEGDAVMTSARQVDEALEVRLFNPTNGRIKATLKNAGAPQALTHFESAELVNLESVPTGEKLKFDKASVSLELKPKQIVTIRLS